MGAPRWTRTEDNLLRDLAGKVPAGQISLVLGRPKAGVSHRIKKLGLSGFISGQWHWNAKVSNLKVSMIGALYDAGYTPAEIHRFLTEKVDVSRNHVSEICQCRQRNRRAA